MIISDRRGFVYIGPPRTASTTLHHWLSQPALCDERWVQDDLHHSSYIPPSALNYYILASVREPLDRIGSLWRHYQQNPHDHSGLPPMGFVEFIARREEMPWLYRTSQATILQGVRLDAVVRFHQLLVDLMAIPAIRPAAAELEPLPRLAASDPSANTVRYTPETESLVRTVWKDEVQWWRHLQ